MPDRQAPRPYDRLAPNDRVAQNDRVAHKWRDLADRRREHFTDMYRSGRWKHYYTEGEFLERMREAISAADVWRRLAPDARPEAAE
jgi:uncharacterized repeat protein (TIGR03809 family)